MSDTPRPPDGPADPQAPDDELVSAVLDDVATAAERARVAADPALTGRLAELRAVAARVAEPVPPPAATVVDTHVAAALAAALDDADPPAAEPGRTDGAGGVVSDLDRRRRVRATRWLGAAAAVVVVGALALVVFGSGGRQDDVASTGFQSVGNAITSAGGGPAPAAPPELGGDVERSDEDAAAGVEDATGGVAPTTVPPAVAPAEPGPLTAETAAGLVALGPLDTSEEVAAAVADELGRRAATNTTATVDVGALAAAEPALARCDTAIRDRSPEITGLALAATTTFRDTPAGVLAYDQDTSGAANGPVRIVVVTVDGSCAVLDDQVP